jgi:hypothetical protein
MTGQSADLKRLLDDLLDGNSRLQHMLANPKRYRRDDDYEKDVAEYVEEMSLGGQWYDPYAMGPQTSIGRKL